MISVTIELNPEELAEIRERTHADTDQEAVHRAAQEYLRLLRLRELKQAPGNFEFIDAGEALEALEVTIPPDLEP